MKLNVSVLWLGCKKCDLTWLAKANIYSMRSYGPNVEPSQWFLYRQQNMKCHDFWQVGCMCCRTASVSGSSANNHERCTHWGLFTSKCVPLVPWAHAVNPLVPCWSLVCVRCTFFLLWSGCAESCSMNVHKHFFPQSSVKFLCNQLESALWFRCLLHTCISMS